MLTGKCPNARFSLQEYLLASVRILRERGAAWVYLVYSAPSAVSHDEVSLVKEMLEIIVRLLCVSDKSSRIDSVCLLF